MDAKRKEILDLYDGLRVTDVNDGMDAVGLQNIGCMSREIRPLWRDIENFKHRIYGFAITSRFIPTNKVIHASSVEEYKKIKKDWYSNLASCKSWMENIQNGDIVVIDGADLKDVGFAGSQNTYGWINLGARGVVTNGGCRDTDECIKQQLPIYSAYIGRGIRPGRLVTDTWNIPVNVGGVVVYPGDLIVADGDGVIVVPQDVACEVGQYAKEVQDGDKAARRKHYEKAGRPFDFTVQ